MSPHAEATAPRRRLLIMSWLWSPFYHFVYLSHKIFSILDGDLPNHRRLPGKVRVIINISKELVERLGILRLDKLFHLM